MRRSAYLLSLLFIVTELPAYMQLGDFNGDGQSDLLFVQTNGTFLCSLTPSDDSERVFTELDVSQLAPDWHLAAQADLNGDGRTDLLFRHTNRTWALIPMDGCNPMLTQLALSSNVADTTWRVVGVTDFDGDERDELILRDENGAWSILFMNGLVVERRIEAPTNLPVDTQWHDIGVGDFTGDGTSDILLRHLYGVWRLFSPTNQEAVDFSSLEPFFDISSDWREESIGDFDGDGREDVLLRHATGKWQVQTLANRFGYAIIDWQPTQIASDWAWRGQAVGDMDGDGADELILNQRESGTWQFTHLSNDDANTEPVVIEETDMTDWRLPPSEINVPDSVLRSILRSHFDLTEESWLFGGLLNSLVHLTASATSFSEMKVVDLHGLRHIESLASLNLSGHNISKITELIGMSLESLDLEGNQIRDISPLVNAKKLESLSLAQNPELKEIDSISSLTNLKYLSLSENRIEDISAISKLTALESLNLSRNRISNIAPLSNLTKLEVLDLSLNKVHDISAVAKLTLLKELNLASNQINDISPLKGLVDLTRLILDSNYIKVIQDLESLTDLKELSLADNEIQDVSPLATMAGLEQLDLSNNKIEDISNLSSLSNLRVLDLSINSINSITQLGNLTNLVSLNLEGNELDESSVTGVLAKLKEGGVSIVYSYQGKFTDSRGRSAHWAYDTEVANDVANGIHVYFHGNTRNSAYGALTDFWWPEVRRIARDQGLVAVIVASPEAAGSVRPFHMPHQDGDTRRWWNYSNDVDLIHEMLQSDFGGELKVDLNRVFLHGSSQGSCFLNEFFKRWGRHYRGGMLLNCGCIDEGNDPLTHFQLQNGNEFRVFLRAATEDFLHDHTKQAYGYYKYTTNFDTRGDLSYFGHHCAYTDVSDDQAMEWLVTGTGLPDNSVGEAHFLRVSQLDQVVGLATEQSGALWVVQQEESIEGPIASLWRSVDRGESYEMVVRVPYVVFDFDIAGDVFFFTTAEGSIYRTRDYGQSFDRLQVETRDAVGLLASNDVRYSAMGSALSAKQPALITTSGGTLLLRRKVGDSVSTLLVSRDFGDTWEYRRIPEHKERTFIYPDPIHLTDDHWYLILNNEFIADDSDMNWKRVLPIYPDSWDQRRISIAWDGRQLIGVDGSNIRFWSSSDGGLRWQEEQMSDGIRGNFFPTLYALDYGSVLQLGGYTDGAIYNGTEESWKYVYGSGASDGRGYGSDKLRKFKVAIDHIHGDVFVTDSRGIFRLQIPMSSGRRGIAVVNDRDDDGIHDLLDAFPDDSSEYLDSDLDGVGNIEDDDDDGDGIIDLEDMVDLDPDESIDTDRDDVGDRSDHDIDGDGILNVLDRFPKNSLEFEDSDNDGIGDWADKDDDNDGVPDIEDAFPWYAHLTKDTDGDFIADKLDPSPEESTVDSPTNLTPVFFTQPRESTRIFFWRDATSNVIYPDLANGNYFYGQIVLGDLQEAPPLEILYVSFDHSNQQLFYLDRNRDGDLTNDGPPMRLKNGTSNANWFEMWVEVSYQDGSTLPYRFNVTNYGYNSFIASSHDVVLYRGARGTSMNLSNIGDVHMIVVDANINALFNDPEDYVCIDLNQNLSFEGCGDEGSEHFAVGQPITADGARYDLKISPSGYSIELNQIEASLVSQSAQKSDSMLRRTEHEHDNVDQYQNMPFQGIEQYIVIPPTDNAN